VADTGFNHARVRHLQSIFNTAIGDDFILIATDQHPDRGDDVEIVDIFVDVLVLQACALPNASKFFANVVVSAVGPMVKITAPVAPR
jgi:hypothetical protein